MEVEAGEKSQRRGLRINIGDFDEMVSEFVVDVFVVVIVVVVGDFASTSATSTKWFVVLVVVLVEL